MIWGLIAITLAIIMLCRANRELFDGGKGATGTEDPWNLATPDLTPCDPSNARTATSLAWLETGNDLKVVASPATDANWTVSGSDLIAKSL